MQISRRDALMGATAAVAVAGVPTAVAAEPDPLREGVQALVDEIRQELDPKIMAGVHWALQQAADRLETLPGIKAVACNYWTAEYRDCARRHGMAQILRGVPS